MVLIPGTQLGPYEIVSLIGSGGMGEVYHARDPKLNRSVAIKVLPDTTATDPERRARFEREAQSIAALTHPNIVTIHSVEDAEGVLFLTMEYVEGKPLSEVIVKGGLPLTQILNLTIPLTDAISTAHQRGITHRDLKPANVMVSTDGRVKVLDFGLAKLMEASFVEAGMTRLPTGALTGEGRIVGTVAYMSPEQAEGKPIDHRSDIFSLGVILHEMATGERPFTGETSLSVLSAILKDTPRSVTDLNPAVPREFARVVKRCLSKEVGRRYQTAVDLRNELEELRTELDSGAISHTATAHLQSGSTSVMGVPATSTVIRAGLTKPITIASIGMMAALLVGGFALLVFKRDLLHRDWSPPKATTHRQITFVGDASFPAISRDGKFLAYIAATPGGPQQKLMVQDLSGGQPLHVFEGERLQAPVWSNDGSELLIASGRPGSAGVSLVPRLGGPARRVGPYLYYRRSWSPDNARFAGIDQGRKEIAFVDKKTGTVSNIPLTGSFTFMMAVDWSPTGDLLLFETRDEQERDAIWTIRVDGSRQEKLVEHETQITSPQWAPKGDAIYYLRSDETKELLKLPVSLRTGKATGSPQVVLAGLQAGDWFTISGDGQELAYTRQIGHANLWLMSTKRPSAGANDVKQLTSGTASDGYPSISPAGRHVAFARTDANRANVFVMPIEGGTPQQITFLNSKNLRPVWSPNGGEIAFGSTEGGQQRVWQVSATGGNPRALEQTRLSTNTFSLAWAPSRHIVYQEPGNRNFQVLNPMTGEQTPLVADSSIGWMFDAHTSPDSSQVAVFWNRTPFRGLWLIPIQKSSEATLLAAQSKVSGTISQAVDASTLRGREVMLVAHVKTNVSGPGNQGQCWLRVDRPSRKIGFFDNMQDRPVQSPIWTEVTIAGKVDGDAERLAFGCFLAGTGQIWVDDIQLQGKNPAGQWGVVPIKNPGFEEGDEGMNPAGWAKSPGYVFQITEASPYHGKRSLAIRSAHVMGSFRPIGWSADGKYVYAINEERQKQIVMIRTDGGEIQPLIDVPLPEGFSIAGVAITPDGQRVVYSAHQGQSDVWIARNFDSAR